MRIADSELATQEVYDLLETYLKQAQDDGVLGTGISPTLLSWVWGKGYEGVARGVSIRQDGSDFELVNIYETDAFRTVIEVAADWFAKGYIRKDYLGTDIQELRKDDGKPLGEGAVVWVHLYDPTKSEEETANGTAFPSSCTRERNRRSSATTPGRTTWRFRPPRSIPSRRCRSSTCCSRNRTCISA